MSETNNNLEHYPVLNKAPIREALLDIRIKPKEKFDVHTLSTLYQGISEKYPLKEEHLKFQGMFAFAKEGTKMSTDSSILGYLFRSNDNKQIMQARIDGFTFNRLHPYDRWDTFRDEAKKLWKAYSDFVSPEVIRIALRYINTLNIPVDSGATVDFDEYLRAAPVVPSELPQGISSFLTRVVIHDDKSDSTAIISQVFEQFVDPKTLPIIFDIDVFKFKEFFTEDEIWQSFEKTRLFKNRIFFSSLTPKALELFK